MKNFTIKSLSSLVKVMSASEPLAKEYNGHSILTNEKSSFQIAFSASEDTDFSINVSSGLNTAIKAFTVRELSSCSGAYKNADDYVITREKSDYPEVLNPYTDNQIIHATANNWSSIWFDIDSNDALPSGIFPIKIDFIANGECIATTTYTIEIINAMLPKQSLIFTNWFHTDCLMNYYNVEAFSDKYWEITENYLATAVKYGMNMVLTPLFTPPLDTMVYGERPTVQLVDVTVTKGKYYFGFDRLDRWVAMCNRVGVDYFEMSHLFTQWGAKSAPKIIANVRGRDKKIFGWLTIASGRRYSKFIDEFAIAIKAYIKSKGIGKRCYFHVSDEPNKVLMGTYKRAAAIIKRNFSEFPIIDALSDYEFYQNKLIQTPIPANDHINAFIGNVPELWTYYCCAQHKDYVSNRFFNMPSQRNRVLGYQLFKYDVVGFLHWGFNYWYTRFSKEVIDPYQVTDAGGAFSAGDSCVVYPNADGTPLVSLRLKVFYDAFQDMRALQLLASLTSKETALAIIERDSAITFNDYPHSDEWQLDTRMAINNAIKEAISSR